MFNPNRSHLSIALIAAGILSGNSALAVRVNPDGHGQALVYPYYTARSTAAGDAFVTAIAVTNVTSVPKALKVRFFEAKAGAEVLDFNLFLGAHDMWTGGIILAGAGAGLFTGDHSCTSPRVSSTAANPTKFRNRAYAGDALGDSLDRTYEGYFEVLEMGTIDPASALARSVTPALDPSSPNASRPSCAGLPVVDGQSADLKRPAGGLTGGVSLININEGTDYSYDATALGQWSDKVQWGGPGSSHPHLADTSPWVSHVVYAAGERDIAYVTQWNSGRDAVTALFMAHRVQNEYTVEPGVRAATDWIVAMPTKRFYVSAGRGDAPFHVRLNAQNSGSYHCEMVGLPDPLDYYDRESQARWPIVGFGYPSSETRHLCGAVSVPTVSFNGGAAATSHLFQSRSVTNISLQATFQNGWLDLATTAARFSQPSQIVETSSLPAPVGATTLIDLTAGSVTTGATATYFGLPIAGFAVQSYSTTGLPGVNPNVLSNFGGVFNHKIVRKVEVAK